MNTECMYVLKKSDVEVAKDFCVKLSRKAQEMNHELYPTYIGRVVRDFKVTVDYDGEASRFTVKEGQIVVWAFGKLHSMYELCPRGARVGFPYKLNAGYFPDRASELVVDLYKYDDEAESFEEL